MRTARPFAVAAILAMAGSLTPTPAHASHNGYFVAPRSIASDCSRPVDAEINAWMRGLPDHSVIQFAYRGCYAQDGSIELVDKNIMTIDGNGSTFKAVTQGHSHRSNWRIRRGTNINLFNMTVIGSNTNGGINDKAYVPALEFQHGVVLESVAGAIVDNVTATNNYGDGILTQFDETVGPSARPVSGVRLTNNRIERTGRQGIALTSTDQAWVEGNSFSEINMNAVDMEPDVPTEFNRSVTIKGNTFGRTRFSVVAALGQSAAPYFTGITITDNVMTAQAVTCQAPIINESPAHGQRTKWSIARNTFNTFSDGMNLTGARDVAITKNTISYTFAGCGRDVGLRLVDSDNVSVTDNRFPGASHVVVADAASTAVTQSGNTL